MSDGAWRCIAGLAYLLLAPHLVVAPPCFDGPRCLFPVHERRVEDEAVLVEARVPPVAEAAVLVAEDLFCCQLRCEQRASVLLTLRPEELIVTVFEPLIIAEVPVHFVEQQVVEAYALGVRLGQLLIRDALGVNSAHVARDAAARVVEDHHSVADVALPHLDGHAVVHDLEEGEVFLMRFQNLVVNEVVLGLVSIAAVPKGIAAWAGQVRHKIAFIPASYFPLFYLAFYGAGSVTG